MNVKRAEGSFTNKREQKLRYAEYMPDGEIKAAVVIHNGFREHIGYGVPVYTKIAGSGYAVFHMEAHGHGLSEPQEPAHKKFTMNSFFHLVDDLWQFIEEIVKADPNVTSKKLPIFGAGNSMGGQIAIILAIQRQQHLKGILLTAPSIDVERNLTMHIQSLFSEVLVRMIPYQRMIPAVSLEEVSGEAEVRDRFQQDELIEKGPVALKTGYHFLKGFAYIKKHEKELTLPVLVVVGSEDRVVNHKALDRFIKNISSKDVTKKTIEGGFHQLLDGKDMNRHAEILVEWLDTHYK